MVVDTSAVVALLSGEPGWEALLETIENAPEVRMSALTLFECRIVLRRLSLLEPFTRFRQSAAVIVDPFDEPQAEASFAAYARFGKGQGHPARLNLADCAAYALATTKDLPLLYKGDDFVHTDVRSAL